MPRRKHTINDIEESLMTSPSCRAKMFSQLCKHVEDGYSLDSFPDLTKHMLTLLFDQFPEEFSVKRLELASKTGLKYWEGIGRSQADGTCLGNSRAWVYNMINRYQWSDRLDLKADVKGSLNVSITNYSTPTGSTD